MSVRKQKVSIVVVTRNRDQILKSCLDSLAEQTYFLDELIVVDNNSEDQTKKVVCSFASVAKFPVKYVLEKKVGYPCVYNRGLFETSYNWVAFIDDDCIAQLDWNEQIHKTIELGNKDVILGFSGTQEPQNIFALATYLFNFEWKEKWSEGTQINNYEILDNKNIIYSKVFLNTHSLQFPEDTLDIVKGAGEDCLLGVELQKAGANAVYEKSIMVRHKDPNNWSWYWKKYFSSLAAYVAFLNKKELNGKNVIQPRKFPFRSYVLSLAKAHLNTTQQLGFIFLVYSTVLVSYVFQVCFTSSRFRAWYIRLF